MTILVDKEMASNDRTSRARIGGWDKFTNKLTMKTELDIQNSGRKCVDKINVYLAEEIEDKLTPVVITIDFTLVEEETVTMMV